MIRVCIRNLVPQFLCGQKFWEIVKEPEWEEGKFQLFISVSNFVDLTYSVFSVFH